MFHEIKQIAIIQNKYWFFIFYNDYIWGFLTLTFIILFDIRTPELYPFAHQISVKVNKYIYIKKKIRVVIQVFAFDVVKNVI